MKNEKVLIIKLGYSETLVGEIGCTTSLGDVLRSTVLLNLFKDANVTWLVDEKAAGLLKGNPYIDRILPYDLTTVLQLKAERFDTVINLEKVAGVCALADSLSAWRRYGFRFDPETGAASPYDGSQRALELCSSHEDKVASSKYWEEILFEIAGSKWQGEIPVIGYKPGSKQSFDLGFNHKVGEKWPIKAWPMEHWKELERLAAGRFTVSWQEGLDSIEDYIDWINSVRLLVTNDSLGLHIAHTLGKNIVALFGPTLSKEVYIKDGVKLLPEPKPDCLPCLSTRCVRGSRSCLYDIKPSRVFEAIEGFLVESAASGVKELKR